MSSTRMLGALDAHRRTLVAILAVVLFSNVFVGVHRAMAPTSERGRPAGRGELASRALAPATQGPTARASVLGRVFGRGGTPRTAITDVREGRAGLFIPGKGTIPNGIHGNELTVVYYWKGDQTKSSPFLRGTGQEGNVDEGEAFTRLMAYINKHADDGRGEIMGFKFNLHGWRFKPIVLEAGKGDDIIRAAEKIAAEIKPFAAVSSHGSISDYVCPRLAKARIFNLSTYDLDWGLTEKTNGFCAPQGLSWGAQVELSIAYLKGQAKEPYQGPAGPEPRKYGLLYAEYPGLVDSAPKVERMLKAEGVPVVDTRSVDPDLTTAGRQQPGVIASFRSKGVNTIIAPDSGSLITFTHAADASGYTPDYYVWPCSGEDSTGMVRLYTSAQWSRASGLTCYDPHLNADLTNDDIARRSQWYRAYREMDPGAEPPAPTSLVYQSLLPLVVGVTSAGRDLTIERYKEGIASFKQYRYDAIEGRTTNPINILVSINVPDGSQVGDAAKVYWDPTTSTPGNATPGTYRFPENRRYARGAAF